MATEEEFNLFLITVITAGAFTALMVLSILDWVFGWQLGLKEQIPQ